MVCRLVIILFALLYALALLLLAMGARGLCGTPRDPLSGVFLAPLGLPWNRLLDRFVVQGNALVGILAPAINLGLLRLICRWGQ